MDDYLLIRTIMIEFAHVYTLSHVMAEVSNSTDLGGEETVRARESLKAIIHELLESQVASAVILPCSLGSD